MTRSPPVYAPRGHEHTTPTHMHQYKHWSMWLYSVLLMLYSCFTPALSIVELSFCFIYTRAFLLLHLSRYVTAVILLYLHIFIDSPALLVLYSYFSWCVCVCVPAYWARRECGGKCGAEERRSMGAWCVAAEGSWWSTATRTASCLSTHPSRSCAGKYSLGGASRCSDCDAGERDGASYEGRLCLLPNLVSLSMTEEDARREHM
jgi:hypothetical protein